MLPPLAAVLEFSPEETRDAATAIRGALKFFVVLAALVVSVFSGGPEVGSRATSAPCVGSPISSGSAKDEEELISGRVYNHEYCSMTAEAKTLACNTVVTATDVFWLGCPGPPSFSMCPRLIFDADPFHVSI